MVNGFNSQKDANLTNVVDEAERFQTNLCFQNLVVKLFSSSDLFGVFFFLTRDLLVE